MDVFTFIAPFYNVIFSSVQKRQGKELLARLSPLDEKKVLDLGGGTGRFAAQMVKAGADVWLVDASPQMLKGARRVLPSDRVIPGNGADLPFPDHTFDVITLVDVFHHISNQADTLQECYRVLRPGGLTCLLEFSPDQFSIRVLAGVERIVGEPSLFLLPEELAAMLERVGFTEVQTEYILSDEYIIQAKK
ncbi:MAG: methyltransferase domain-containing protein [Bacillota bacterium]|nr:methyltransferase domain-containing protein [Bacillota bacterium]